MKRKLVEQNDDGIKSNSNFDLYIQSSRALVAQADCMDDSDEARDHYKKAYLKCKAALKLKPDHPGVKAQIKYIKKELQRIKEAQDLDEAEESQAIYVQEDTENSDDIENVQIRRKILKKQTKIEQVQVKQAEKVNVEQDKSEFAAVSPESVDIYGVHREAMISVKKYIEFVEGMAPGEYERIDVVGGEGENFNLYPMDLA